jgi:hypothetical protein
MDEAKKADNTFKPLPADDYDFVISKAEAAKTKDGLKDKLRLQAKVISGEYARKVVFVDMTLSWESAQAMSIFFRQMKVLGLDEDYFAAEPSMEKVAADLVGRVFRGSVILEPGWNKVTQKADDEENPRNQIRNFSTPSAEARQAALSVPTSNNPNPAASPSAGASAPATPAPAPAVQQASPPAPAPETLAAPEPPVAAPPAPPSSGMPIPPPPPPPSF